MKKFFFDRRRRRKLEEREGDIPPFSDDFCSEHGTRGGKRERFLGKEEEWEGWKSCRQLFSMLEEEERGGWTLEGWRWSISRFGEPISNVLWWILSPSKWKRINRNDSSNPTRFFNYTEEIYISYSNTIIQSSNF